MCISVSVCAFVREIVIACVCACDEVLTYVTVCMCANVRACIFRPLRRKVSHDIIRTQHGVLVTLHLAHRATCTRVATRY